VSFGLPFRMNAVISETIRVAILGLGMQIPEIPAQRKLVSSLCHVPQTAQNWNARHSNAFFTWKTD